MITTNTAFEDFEIIFRLLHRFAQKTNLTSVSIPERF